MEIYLCHMMFFRIVEKLHSEKYIENNNLNYVVNCILVLLMAGMFSYAWKKYVEPKVVSYLTE